MCFTLQVHVHTCENVRPEYGEIEVQVEVQVCTKYSAYFEMSKGNDEMFRVQILGSHEVYRVCMDIIHSLHERYIFIRTYVRMGKARRHEGVLPYPTERAEGTRGF